MKPKFPHALLTVIIFTFVLRLPTLIEPHWLADEGIYAAAAALWSKDFRLYRDIWINVPPGIFAIYKFGYLLEQVSTIDILFWARLTACIAVALTQIALFKISLLLLKINKLKSQPHSDPVRRGSTWHVSLVAPVLYGLLTSLPFWEGNMANTEIFMVALTTWGIYIIVKNLKFKVKSLLFLGACLLGSALLFKAVAIAEISLGFILLLFNHASKKKGLARRLLLYVGGITFPITLTCFFFLWQGTLGNFIQSNLIFNLHYSSLPLQNAHELIAINFARVTIILGAIFLYWQNRTPVRLALCWLIFSTVGASLGLRPFLHYLIPIFIPLSLLLPLTVQKRQTFFFKLLTFNFALLTLLVPINQKFHLTASISYHFDSFGYYTNFVNFVSGKKARSEYNNFFSNHVNINNKISIFTKTQESGTVFILTGNREPWLYYALFKKGFKPATPYLSYFFFEIVPGAFNKTLQQLTIEPPEYIIAHPNIPMYRQIESIMRSNYQLLTSIDGFEIWSNDPTNHLAIQPFNHLAIFPSRH